MIISIGGLVFNALNGNGFNQVNNTKRGEYTELKLADGAMSQRQGRGLDKKVLSAQWLGVEATDHVKLLDTLLTGYHVMSDLAGNNLGLWTLDSYTDNGTDVFGGVTVCHNVTLNLTEYR